MRRNFGKLVKSIVTPGRVLDAAVGILQRHLAWRDHGRTASAGAMYRILLLSAARVWSLSAACRALRDGPSEETVRSAVCRGLSGDPTRRLNAALAERLPAVLRRRPQVLAADVTMIPYHGLPQSDPAELCRSKAKGGTTHFHGYATVYVVRRGLRYTVAMTAVRGDEGAVDILRRLLRAAVAAGVRCRLLLLDRGFYAVRVLRYLKRRGTPFLMPLKAAGRTPRPGRRVAGGRRFFTSRRSGWHTHVVRSSVDGAVRVNVCVRCRNLRGRYRRRGRERQAFACWGRGVVGRDPAWVAETYRRRFAIETTYRQMNECRIRTTSRCPLRRLLFAGLALLLRNLWVRLHREVFSTPCPGGHEFHPERLRLQTLLQFLSHAAASQFGWNIHLPSDRPMQPDG